MDIQQIRELTLGKYEANKALMLKKTIRRDLAYRPGSGN
jgi:hypothetical protein